MGGGEEGELGWRVMEECMYRTVPARLLWQEGNWKDRAASTNRL